MKSGKLFQTTCARCGKPCHIAGCINPACLALYWEAMRDAARRSAAEAEEHLAMLKRPAEKP